MLCTLRLHDEHATPFTAIFFPDRNRREDDSIVGKLRHWKISHMRESAAEEQFLLC